MLWKPIAKTVIDDQTGDKDEEHRYFLLRAFSVFSADQVEGEAAEQYQVHEEPSTPHAEPDFQPAEELFAATQADIRYDGDRAYYTRPVPNGSSLHHAAGDFIVLPPKATFDPPGAFYETAVHELAHWSEARTGWDDRTNGYALGELAAENRYLFQTERCGKFSTRRVEHIVRKYALAAGVNATPHTFRHQAITWLTRTSGLADAELQLITGDAKRETLAIYQHVAVHGQVADKYQAAMKEVGL